MFILYFLGGGSIEFNKKIAVTYSNCPVTFCMERVRGKWKPVIIYLILKGANIFVVLHQA